MQAISRLSAAPVTVQALEHLASTGAHVDGGGDPGPSLGRAGRSSVVAQVGIADGAQVVQFVDRRTGELVAQLPAEAVLRLVEQLVDRARRRLA